MWETAGRINLRMGRVLKEEKMEEDASIEYEGFDSDEPFRLFSFSAFQLFSLQEVTEAWTR